MAARDLRHAEKEMHKADKEFSAAEKAMEKGDLKSAEKHEIKAHTLVAAAEQHAAHANAAANAILGSAHSHTGAAVVQATTFTGAHYGAHHGSFHNGTWSGGFMHVPPTAVYNGHPVGDYDPTFNYPEGHPYHHHHFQYNGQPLGAYNATTVYPDGHPYHGFGDHLRGGSHLGGRHNFGEHHGAFANGAWTGGFMQVPATTVYNGQPIGNYDPFFNYAEGHPYHHSNFKHNGQPIGAYNPATTYAEDHPYYALRSHKHGHSSAGAINQAFNQTHRPHHGRWTDNSWRGGFLHVAPTTVYNGQPIGDYDPYFDYAEDHPYHHHNFKYNGQPVGRFNAGTVYPEDHPFFGIGHKGSHYQSQIPVGVGIPVGGAVTTGAAVVQVHNIHGEHHGTWFNGTWLGGFGHISPATTYQGRIIGSWSPLVIYPEGHPYHHANFSHGGSPIGPYTSGTNYPAGHPYHGIMATGVASELFHHSHGPHHGGHHGGKWEGGFMNVPHTTVYNGQPIGHYDPLAQYPQGHPYHHANFQYENQPLPQYQEGTAYAQNHPYSGLGYHGTHNPSVIDKIKNAFGPHHGRYNNGNWEGGFMQVAPSTVYQGQPIGHYNPGFNYPEDHPYHHRNFQYNGQPLGAYNAGTAYPQGHPYHDLRRDAAGATGAVAGGVTGAVAGGLIGGPVGAVVGGAVGAGVGAAGGATAHNFGPHHGRYNNGRWEGGFLDASPTSVYQGQPIGHYNPGFNYPEDHPYHHRHFQYNGQPLGAYNSTTTYPNGHPYHTLSTGGAGLAGAAVGGATGAIAGGVIGGPIGAGVGGLAGAGVGAAAGAGSHAFGPHHGRYNNDRWEGGFMNVAPTTVYQGQPIGHYQPGFNYAEDHPYHHRNFQHNGQPIGAYNATTAYPQDHPYHGVKTGVAAGGLAGAVTGGVLGGPIGAGVGGATGAGLGAAAGVAHAFGPHHGKYNNGRWEGGFMNVAPNALYREQPIGNYNPTFDYPEDHPYHHQNFRHNGQPIGRYSPSSTYPEGHPYYGISPSLQKGGLGAAASDLAHGHGPHHGKFNNGRWEGGFMNVAPTTLYNGQPVGNYDPKVNYNEDHPYHHRNFQYNGQPVGQFNAASQYPQGHPYYGLNL